MLYNRKATYSEKCKCVNEVLIMYCSNCGKQIDDKAVICPECGVSTANSKKEETKLCKLCKTEMPKGAHICPNCGVKQSFIVTAKLKKCKYCGGDMASNQKSCPHCGKPPLRIIMAYIACGIIIIWTIILISSISTSVPTETTGAEVSSNSISTDTVETVQPEETIHISAVDLLNAFAENEISAQQTYKGKTIVVTGVASDMGITEGLFSETTYMLFSSSGANSYLSGTVQANFTNKEEIAKLAEVKKGQEVSIKGTCTGESLFNIMLNNCFIVSK